jgi:hypothetical protein
MKRRKDRSHARWLERLRAAGYDGRFYLLSRTLRQRIAQEAKGRGISPSVLVEAALTESLPILRPSMIQMAQQQTPTGGGRAMLLCPLR